MTNVPGECWCAWWARAIRPCDKSARLSLFASKSDTLRSSSAANGRRATWRRAPRRDRYRTPGDEELLRRRFRWRWRIPGPPPNRTPNYRGLNDTIPFRAIFFFPRAFSPPAAVSVSPACRVALLTRGVRFFRYVFTSGADKRLSSRPQIYTPESLKNIFVLTNRL